jgi:HPt (histidine-containing phosphotransfer) domain-containing protein
MKSADHDTQHAKPGPPDIPAGLKDRFENLRIAYYARLAGDRTELLKLRIDFDRTEFSARRIYDDIRHVAHGMAGAATLFEAAQISGIARELEETALEAARAPSTMANAAVRTQVDSLMELLRTFEG